MGTVNGTYDDQDRLLSYGNATYIYTANGELKTKKVGTQITTYDYDELGNLIGVALPDGKKITYLIDGANRRVGKKINGVLVQAFLYDGWLRPVAELDGVGRIVSHFVYATHINVPYYIIKGGATYRVETDHLSSPRMIVNATNGAIVQQIDYDEFGNVLADSNPGFQPFGFAGGIADSDTRFARFGARDYDATSGRWTTKDPIKFSDRSSNLYDYTGGDPINRTDPLGLSYLVYNDTAQSLELFDTNGNQIGQWEAANNVGANTNGPWPIDLEITNPFSHYNPHPEAATPNSAYGSNGIFVFTYPGRTGMGVHSGRRNQGGPRYRTLGCIRTTDAATEIIKAVQQGGCSETAGMCFAQDPLTAIVVTGTQTRGPVSGQGQ